MRTAREWTLWEIAQARHKLAISLDASDDGEGFSARRGLDLDSALTHAVRAWCRTHLRCKDARGDHDSYFQALDAKAPKVLAYEVFLARNAIYRRLEKLPGISTRGVVTLVKVAVESLLKAASRPPRNRLRFPAHLRLVQTPRKPRVRPGSWIETGRYRPALVLEIMPEPPHIMKLSYGDETDEDFRPHIWNWRSIRRPNRVDSLKDVFSPGNWFRHPRCGYGRVLEVRNSTMDAEFQGKRATFAPDRGLRYFEKVEGPEPEDTRPLAERFPPGSWIDQADFGRGIVLGSGEGMNEKITVLFSGKAIRIDELGEVHDLLYTTRVEARVFRIAEGAVGEGPVIWKLDKKPLDLSGAWGRRWAWWWQHKDIFMSPVCRCCGYPNLGDAVLVSSPRECIICGYPDFAFGFDDEADGVCVCLVGNHWWHRPMWDDDLERPLRTGPMKVCPTDEDLATGGYSLSEARQNYEIRGTMFRPDVSSPLVTEVATGLRVSLVRLLEMARAEPPLWTHKDRMNAEQIKGQLRAELSKAKDLP